MIRNGFRPSRQLLRHLAWLCVWALVLPGLGQWFEIPQLQLLPWVAFVVLLLISAVDYLFSRIQPKLSAERTSPNNLSIYVEQLISLKVSNHAVRAYEFELEEHIPNTWSLVRKPEHCLLQAGQDITLSYKVLPQKRGLAEILASEFRIRSQLGYWQFNWLIENKQEIKVYPNFSVLSDMAGLNGSVNLSQAGLKKINLRGSGMDFRQLREYREGESLKQIDWRATSRFNKLISKEFQEEKNQHVIIMLDAGRRMLVQDEHMSYFDHALNSLILLAHTALKNGDRLSFQSFGSDTRWLGNMKGIQSVSKIMHHFYDLYPHKIASDYLQAAENLLSKQPKRSLILLVSCLRDEDFSDLFAAVKLLQRVHLVAIITITEPIYQQINDQEIKDFEQALLYSSAQLLRRSINNNIQRLKKSGVICISCPAEQLNANIINTYLGVKRAGLL
jgi:uncharacterized protein (DUF58 family)